MWRDSSAEAFEFLSAHGEKDEWRDGPPDERPSLRKYWRERSIDQMIRRIWNGALARATQNARAIGYYKFVLAVVIAAGWLAFRYRNRFWEVVSRNRFAAVFCVVYFA